MFFLEVMKCRIPAQSSIGGKSKQVRLAFLVGAGLLASPAAAQDANWLAAPGSNDFNAGANWSTGSLPTGTASFGASSTTTLSLSGVTSLDSLQFSAGAPGYAFGSASFTLNLTGAGIVNNSSNAPTLAVSGNGLYDHSTLNFYNSSTAANAIITSDNYGTTIFYDTSSAGSATITTNNAGFVNFRGSSSAGNATINNAGGVVNFYDASTAGSATIVNSGSSGTVFWAGTAGSATITNNAGTQTTFVGDSTAGNATLINNNGGTTLFAWTSTAGAARLIANAGGVVDFSASTGPSNDQKLSAGSLEGAGNFYLGANQITVGGNNLSTTVSGIISDCGAGSVCTTPATGGSLVKTGTGTLVLAGANTYTGGTTVSAGTLFVSGSIASSATTVDSGATLAGTGTVGGVTVASGGIFAPGDGTAASSINVSGSLALQSGAAYLIQVSPSTASAAFVTGTATLGGATAYANFAGGSYLSKRYTVVTAAGGVSGTFGSLVTTSLPTNTTAALSYDANSAYLDLLLDFAIPSGLNRNQQAVANALTTYFNTTGGIPTVYSALTPAGLTQASGEIATGSQQATFNAMTQFMGAMTDPFTGGRGDPAARFSTGASQFADADAASAYASTGRKRSAAERDAYAAIYRKAPAADVFTPAWSVWAAGYGGSQTTDGNGTTGSNTASSRVFGTSIGADYRFSPSTIAGFALAGGGTNFGVANSGTGRSDLFQAGAFVRHTAGRAYLSAALAYGWQDVTTNRTVTIAGADQLQARFNANAYSGRVEGGYRFVTPWMGLTPYAAAQFTTFDLPAYAKTRWSAATPLR